MRPALVAPSVPIDVEDQPQLIATTNVPTSAPAQVALATVDVSRHAASVDGRHLYLRKLALLC